LYFEIEIEVPVESSQLSSTFIEFFSTHKLEFLEDFLLKLAQTTLNVAHISSISIFNPL